MTTVVSNTRLIESDTGDYPVYLYQLSSRVEGTIFPSKIDSDALIEFGYEVVNEVDKPAGDVVTEGAPELRDGEWYRTWIVRSFSEEELSVNLAAAKEQLEPQIEAFRVSSFEKGFPYQFAEGLYHVQIRTTDRLNITSIRTVAKEAIAAGGVLPVSFRVYENVSVQLTAEEFVAMSDATFARVIEGYAVVHALKDQIKSATTLAELPTIPYELFAPVEAFVM